MMFIAGAISDYIKSLDIRDVGLHQQMGASCATQLPAVECLTVKLHLSEPLLTILCWHPNGPSVVLQDHIRAGVDTQGGHAEI